MKSQKPLLDYLGNKKKTITTFISFLWIYHEVTMYNYILVVKDFDIVYYTVDTKKSLKVPNL